MKWLWKGDFLRANRPELELIKTQLESERFPDPKNKEKNVGYYQLSQVDQNTLLKDRLKDYSKKVYKTAHKTHSEERESTICQRENPFYVDTVRAFRDRRYIYKTKLKEAQQHLAKVQQVSIYPSIHLSIFLSTKSYYHRSFMFLFPSILFYPIYLIGRRITSE